MFYYIEKETGSGRINFMQRIMNEENDWDYVVGNTKDPVQCLSRN